MKAIVINTVINSLYSIRSPLTWQAALTYPVLPPSAVIGLLGNAIQRYRNSDHPLESLNEMEKSILWAGSRLLSSLVVRGCTTSAVVKWEVRLGEKCTNVLVREFACARRMQLVAMLKGEEIACECKEAVKSTPLTCGDSESPMSVDDVRLCDVEEYVEEACETVFPVPFDDDVQLLEGDGVTYWMHDRCRQTEKTFPLKCYMVPVREENGLIMPSTLKVKVKAKKIFSLEKLGQVIL